MITDTDIFNSMYSFGQIIKIHLAKQSNCAFVEFETREMAENTINSLYNALLINNIVIPIKWAKQKETNSNATSTQVLESIIPPPPGMEFAPVGSYAVNSSTNMNIAGLKRSYDSTKSQQQQTSETNLKRNNALNYPSMNPSRLGSNL